MHACAARSHFIKMCIVECRMSPGMAMGLQLVGYVNKCVCVCMHVNPSLAFAKALELTQQQVATSIVFLFCFEMGQGCAIEV